jgi:hypothetical protein
LDPDSIDPLSRSPSPDEKQRGRKSRSPDIITTLLSRELAPPKEGAAVGPEKYPVRTNCNWNCPIRPV